MLGLRTGASPEARGSPMSEMRRICVNRDSSPGLLPDDAASARGLERYLAEQGLGLVLGG